MDDPELRLAAAACRASYSGSVLEGAIPAGICWRRLLQIADRHRVQALCWHGLGRAQERAPADVSAHFGARSQETVEAHLRAVVECSRLAKKFGDSGVELLFLKGLTLAALSYPKPALKMSWDIDILVSPDQLREAAGALHEAGYVPLIPAGADGAGLATWHAARKESVWRHCSSDQIIDLHTRLADHPQLLPGVGMTSPRQLVTVARGIELPTLAKEELFAYLCVHGASSAWFRLKWLADLAAMLQRESPVEIERLYKRSQLLGVGRTADQALLLSQRIFGLDLGVKLHKCLAGRPISRWLTNLAEAQLTNPREPTERFLGTASIHYSQPFLLPGWRFKLSGFLRQVRSKLAMQIA